jgi:clan AA aspartic protease
MSQEKTLAELERQNKDLQEKNERLKKEIATAVGSLPKDYLDILLEGKPKLDSTLDTPTEPGGGITEQESTMPQIYENITIENSKNSRQVGVSCLVDTGASGGLVINELIRRQLGLEIVGTSLGVLADGSEVTHNVTDDVTVYYEGEQFRCQVRVLPQADTVLLGISAIEELKKLGYEIDPERGRLVKRKKIVEPPQPPINPILPESNSNNMTVEFVTEYAERHGFKITVTPENFMRVYNEIQDRVKHRRTYDES